jgi:hypothetical protein
MHAYTISGEARHYQKTKSKSAKSDTRPTNIRDIREHKLFPSVTEYCKMLAAPGLEEYKKTKIIEACFNYAAPNSVDLAAYRNQILIIAGKEPSDAADLGTKIHASIETYLTNKEQWDGEEIFNLQDGRGVQASEFVLPVIAKLNDLNIIVDKTETVVVNPTYGYGGTVDLIGKRAGDIHVIVDFKSKKTKEGEEVEAQETHPLQIAAYMAAILKRDWSTIGEWNEMIEGYNIYVSTTEIGRVEHITHNSYELFTAWNAFKHCVNLWEWRNGYSAAVKQ